MDDRELDIVLRSVGAQRITPSPSLVRRTKARVKGRRLIQIVAILSLLTQMIVLGMVIYAMASPEINPTAKLFGAACLISWMGAIAVVIVGARSQVSWFFRRVECILS